MPLRYALLLLFLLPLAARAQTFITYFEIPGDPSLHGLDYHDGYLWATVRSSQAPRILQIDPADGSVVGTTPLSVSFSPTGVTWDGADFWIARDYSSSARLYRVSTAGQVLADIPAPSPLSNGLAYHDGQLWVAKAYPDAEAALVAVDPSDGTVLETIPFPATQPGGIAFLDDDTIWTTNVGDDSGSDLEVLWKLDRTTGDVLDEVAMPEGAGRPRGLAYDGVRYLYAVMDEPGSSDDVVYKIDLGTSGNPVFSATATGLDFGVTPFDSPDSQALTLFNEGDGPLAISNVTITGPGAGAFETTLADATIEPGGQLPTSIAFSPETYGPHRAALTFSTNDVANPQVSVTLDGVGVHPQRHVGFVADAHDFGAVRIEDPFGRSLARWPLRIVNEGAGPLEVSGVALDDPAFSVVAGAFPLVLAAADTAIVEVGFHPPAVGSYARRPPSPATTRSGPRRPSR